MTFSSTGTEIESQESMFEEPADFPAEYPEEASYEEKYVPEDELPALPLEEPASVLSVAEEMPVSLRAWQPEPAPGPVSQPATQDTTPHGVAETPLHHHVDHPGQPEQLGQLGQLGQLVQAGQADQADQAGQADEPDQPLTVMTIDDFAALEERVLKAVSLVRHERQARFAAEARVAELEAELIESQIESQNQAPIMHKLQQEIDALRIEREQVRQRVERLLGQLDALEL